MTVGSALVGAIVAGIAAINLVIIAGVQEGYEASIGEVFEESILVGVVTVAILVAGPVVGAIVGWRNGARR